MRRENRLYNDEDRSLPFLVQLVRLDGMSQARPEVPPTLMLLDLRGGEFSWRSRYQLEKTFDWLTRALSIRKTDLTEYALMITRLPRPDDEQITGRQTPYIPDDWPVTRDQWVDLRERSFLWMPVAFDENEERYAWQRT